MSTVIVLLMKHEYALSDNRNWREQVSPDGITNEMGIITYCLRVESEGKYVSIDFAAHEI